MQYKNMELGFEPENTCVLIRLLVYKDITINHLISFFCLSHCYPTVQPPFRSTTLSGLSGQTPVRASSVQFLWYESIQFISPSHSETSSPAHIGWNPLGITLAHNLISEIKQIKIGMKSFIQIFWYFLRHIPLCTHMNGI